MGNLISIDVETTGTDIRRHEVWELALVYPDGDKLEWQFPVDLKEADPMALQINDYYERARYKFDLEATHSVHAHEIARYTVGATLMGCAVGFDMAFTEKLLRRYNAAPAWHHRGFDLGSYAAGILGEDRPLSSAKMQKLCPNDSAHTALGDAQWNWSMYNWLKARAPAANLVADD